MNWNAASFLASSAADMIDRPEPPVQQPNVYFSGMNAVPHSKVAFSRMPPIDPVEAMIELNNPVLKSLT